MTKQSDELLKRLMGMVVDDDEIAIYPTNRFELEIVDESRVLLKVHFFASPDDHAKDKSSSLNFIVPAADVARLSNLLNLVQRDLKEVSKKRIN